MGGSGSLLLDSDRVGEAHLNHPLQIGRIDAAKGYVHVFDDTSLNVVMMYLDTISDFVAYPRRKKNFTEASSLVDLKSLSVLRGLLWKVAVDC
jgi:hypothetical protein